MMILIILCAFVLLSFFLALALFSVMWQSRKDEVNIDKLLRLLREYSEENDRLQAEVNCLRNSEILV